MESERHQHPFPSPSQNDRFTFLKDVSNLKTPKRISHSQLFTASKQTPKSFSTIRRTRPSLIHSASASRSKAVRRLKAFELEQYKSSHRVQINKEKSLQSLAKSLTVWLNFLLQDPAACGCDVSKFNCEDESVRSEVSPVKGKRDIRPIRVVGVDKAWRSPKRQRGSSWRGGGGGYSMVLSSSVLQESLQDICSFDDLKDRMRAHMSLDICREIFEVMEKVVKNIDERRLSMKPHCPLVTDVGMKEKALKILTCYNSHWLRIGLYIIFGGDSLLPDGDISSDQEIAFLKLVIEKQFFSHVGLAKTYSYNKLVEGLYRPGYFEKLGSVILKRFLLLALILDRVKLHTCLSVKYGIDGLDGGSPLLFTIESKIKSSSQLVKEFLSTDAMHGEGSILAHLVIVGYKVSYQQNPLNEYDFKVKELFEDLQDGVRLCRVIQLLKQDSSILLKLIVPSDTQKKNLNNCGIALQYLKLAGVPQVDEDGEVVQVEDIVNGDKELTLAILWNIFVHLQLPLLLDKNVLLEEISKIRCVSKEVSKCTSSLDMLLLWIQAICDSYDLKINNFASLVDGKAIWCLLDFYFRKEFHCSCPLKEIQDTVGEASIMSAASYTDAIHNFILSQKLTTLLGKFPEVLQVSDIIEHNGACSSQSVIILLVFLSLQLVVRKNMDQLNFHKFLGLTCLNPEKRRLSTEFCFVHSEAALIQEDSHGNANEDGIQNFKAIMAWWQNMAQQNKKLDQQHATITIQRLPSGNGGSDTKKENAAKLLQSHFRGTFQRRKFLRTKSSVSFLQVVIRAWLTVKKETYMKKFSCNEVQVWNQTEAFCRHLTFMHERHTFVKLKKSVSLIQHAARNWISVRHAVRSMSSQEMPTENIVDAIIVIQKFVRGWIMRCKYLTMITQLQRNFPPKNGIDGPQTKAASKIQNSWKEFIVRRSLCRQNSAAIKIQSYYRGLLLRKTYIAHIQVAMAIQNAYRCFKCQRELQHYKVANNSALVIQSHIRGWIARRRAYQFSHYILLIHNKAASKIQNSWKEFIARRSLCRQNSAAIKIQSYYRGLLLRKTYIAHMQAAMAIQNAYRCFKCQRELQKYKVANNSALVIQSHIRGWIARRRAHQFSHYILLIQTKAASKIQNSWKEFIARRSLCLQNSAAIKIQSYYRGLLLRKTYIAHMQVAVAIQNAYRCFKCQRELQHYKVANNSALVIQSHIRGWIARRRAYQFSQYILLIQSHFRGWITRKELSHKKKAATRIQSAFRCFRYMKVFRSCRLAVIEIQRFVRAHTSRRRLLGASHLSKVICAGDVLLSRGCFGSIELDSVLRSVLILQRWWRSVLLLKSTSRATIIIQSHTRGWIARREANRDRHQIVLIQSYWRGYFQRKGSKEKLVDLRLRMQNTAANVDDSKRLINRLVAAVSELLSMKSASGILYTCMTLDLTTQHSQKCCERLVEAGAIDTLVKLIRSVSRSKPDQEILKYTLSTIRNLARYPHLIEILISSNGSVQTILQEFLRNKEEAYFIASELLKKISLNKSGLKALRSSAFLLKRLHSLVEDLIRKAANEKRKKNPSLVLRDQIERRLKVAAELLHLITRG